ncbi:MAG TPA: protoheme IX farnesyltransferase, partial [Motiliproteus sp.]
SGPVYLLGVMLLNLRFLLWAWRVFRGVDPGAPLSMFLHSINYIMALFVVLLVDHYVPLLAATLF